MNKKGLKWSTFGDRAVLKDSVLKTNCFKKIAQMGLQDYVFGNFW
jgi:hypothetical protein